MIGYFDYTVWLTYMSLMSAGLGIMVTLSGGGHPYMGIFFLMFCGLCDAFDGRVARTKKDRTEFQKKYGIQVDSLSDIVAFGVLPAVIGNAMIRVSPNIYETPKRGTGQFMNFTGVVLLYTIIVMYLLAALIRLAYFNVKEEERQSTEEGNRKYFQGLPVTSAALIFPTVLLLQFISSADITLIYFAVMLVVTFLFIADIKIPKPGLRGILIMCGIGAVEFAIFAVTWFMFAAK